MDELYLFVFSQHCTSSAILTLLQNLFADKTGIINMMIPTTIITGILGLAWIGIKDEAGLIVFAVLYGSFSGLLLALMPVGVPSLVEDKRLIGTNMGVAFMIGSVGILIGTPISGAILHSSGSFAGLQAFGGVAVVISGILFGVARISKVGVGWTKI